MDTKGFQWITAATAAVAALGAAISLVLAAAAGPGSAGVLSALPDAVVVAMPTPKT